jgi:phosphohistidine phosphatase
MKKIWLMRHAKSSWDHPQLSDHERPLNSRGRKDALFMATRIQNSGVRPQLVLSSDSRRTRETYEGLCSILGDLPVNFTPSLYHASAHKIHEVLKNAADNNECILVLAHNPGITNAFEILCKVRIDNVPTSGIGLIHFDAKKFNEIRTGSGDVQYFSYPKKDQ